MKLYYIIICSFILFSCTDAKQEKALPFLGNYDIDYKMVDGKEIEDTIYPQIPEFKYLNEDSVWVTNKDFKGKVWIAEFFFASCPTICPIMNNQMKRFVDKTKDIQKHIQILSFTISPDEDSPSVLKSYKEKYNIKQDNWSFLTGNAEIDVNQLGIDNFLIFSGRDDEAEGGYAHSGAFTLVDKEGYVRGVYPITNFDGSVNENEFNRLNKEVRKLLKYEYKHNIRE